MRSVTSDVPVFLLNVILRACRWGIRSLTSMVPTLPCWWYPFCFIPIDLPGSWKPLDLMPPKTSWGLPGSPRRAATLKPSPPFLGAFPVGHSDLMGFACTLSHTLALLSLSVHIHGFGDTLLVTPPKYCLVLTLASISSFIWVKGSTSDILLNLVVSERRTGRGVPDFWTVDLDTVWPASASTLSLRANGSQTPNKWIQDEHYDPNLP